MRNRMLTIIVALCAAVFLGSPDASAMNKAELIDAVAVRSGGLTRAEAERSVDLVFEVIRQAVGRDNKVEIIGFGTFIVDKRAARDARNPQTGEAIRISPERVSEKGRPAGAAAEDATTAD